MATSLGTVHGLCFFIVGVPRSGTTVLRLALNSHHDICVPAETWFFRKLSRRAAYYGGFDTDEQIGRFARDVAGFRVEVDQRFGTVFEVGEAEIADVLRRAQVGNFAQAFWALMVHFASREGKTIWGEKTAFYTSIMPTLAECYPEARFIVLLRDPRDVVGSLHNTPWGKQIYPSLADAALRWRVGMREVEAGLRHLDAARWLPVHYEQMAREPEHWLRQICDFLGVAFDPNMLSFHERTDRFITRTSQAWHPNTFKPISAASVERWRGQYSPEQVGLIEMVCGSRMSKWGYAREGRAVTPGNLLAWQGVQVRRVQHKLRRLLRLSARKAEQPQ
jgi:hypothetical protein